MDSSVAVEDNDFTYWNPSDMNRMTMLQNGTINQKIKALIEAGLTPEQIKKSLVNDADFRALIKNGDDGFNVLYTYEKREVDSLNKYCIQFRNCKLYSNVF